MVAHEYAHGYAALSQGDDTALQQGRLTLNPLRHIDPFLTVLMPLMLLFASGGQFVFGGAKPVPVDPRNYRDIRRGDIIVSSAGIVANLILFAVCVVLVIGLGSLGRWVGDPAGVIGMVQRMVAWGVWLNLLLAFFNLIPIPPLDGANVVGSLLPPRQAHAFRRLGRYGFIVLFALVFSGALRYTLFPLLDSTARLLMGL